MIVREGIRFIEEDIEFVDRGLDVSCNDLTDLLDPCDLFGINSAEGLEGEGGMI